MTKYLVLVLGILGAQSSFAKATLCPKGSAEVIACTADAFIPLYPFISICKDQSGAFAMVRDVGAGRTPGLSLAAMAETATDVSFKVSDDPSDDSTLTVSKTKNTHQKTVAVLSYTLGPLKRHPTYTCNDLKN